MKRIEYSAFCGCKELRSVVLPGKLEHIGKFCFYKSCLGEIVLPPSVKTIGVCAFQDCAQLRHVVLNEGLEALGEMDRVNGEQMEGQVFCRSGIESVRIPSTLKTIQTGMFF